MTQREWTLDEVVQRNIAESAAKRRRTNRQQARLALLRLLAPIIPNLGRSLPLEQSPIPTPQSLLLIRPDHLGDVLFTTPALHDLRQRYPQARITALIGPWAEPVVAGNPDLDRLITCPFPGFQRQPKSSAWEPYRMLWSWARQVRQESYDVAFVLRPDHWWGALLAALAGIPRRVGYAVPEVAPFLTDARPLPAGSGRHEVEQNLALFDEPGLGRSYAPGEHPLRFTPSLADRQFVLDFLAPYSSSARLIAIHPGAGADVKRWLADRWAMVADRITAEYSARIVLTGSQAEIPLCQEIAARMSSSPVILAGQTSLGQLAAVFERCAAVLGPDCGPLHLAVAVGTPTVHLYGPADPLRFGPWGDPRRHRVLQSPLGCVPCGHLDWQRLEDHPCMREIGVEWVVREVRELRVTR